MKRGNCLPARCIFPTHRKLPLSAEREMDVELSEERRGGVEGLCALGQFRDFADMYVEIAALSRKSVGSHLRGGGERLI